MLIIGKIQNLTFVLIHTLFACLEGSLNFEIKMSNIMLQLLIQTYGHGCVLILAMIKRPNVIKCFYPIVVMMVMVKSSVFGKVHS